MTKKSRVSNKGQLIRTRRCRRGQAMDFRVALTSAIAADRASNGFEFQRSLSQHLHWYFPNRGGHMAGCSLRFLFADPSISSPANSNYTNESLTFSPSAPGTEKNFHWIQSRRIPECGTASEQTPFLAVFPTACCPWCTIRRFTALSTVHTSVSSLALPSVIANQPP